MSNIIEEKIQELENTAYQKYEVSTDLLTSFANQNPGTIKYYLASAEAAGLSGISSGLVESFKLASRKLRIFQINNAKWRNIHKKLREKLGRLEEIIKKRKRVEVIMIKNDVALQALHTHTHTQITI